ncbi:MAG: dihydrofolate reductase family protein [Candidatus Parvarchaeum sp.]|nr:dihydrofolate reductase family protein [Candidatus Parvarchaeota archaeon]MCW1294872.1 dihydrofolate reductase family protein [Candidatus Parvarchaeum tengchongense]MCW1295700.1 dihydrofolate reductase family protein [Candidatus Parvarchaeum tengchongense]MCW1298751.1 dihydrofolate reductase family protein [Candidatus Parvarchaeum tengchongense]
MSFNLAVYMHVSINGMIARSDNSDFSSELARFDFLKTMKKYKVNVIGRNTFKIASKSNGFPLDGLNIVVTKHKIKLKREWKNVIVTDKKPKDIIKIIESKGYKSAMVAGGKLATSFLKEGLVNEIYLNVEPIAFGKGIPIFTNENFETKLELLQVKRFSKNEVRLRYRVLN